MAWRGSIGDIAMRVNGISTSATSGAVARGGIDGGGIARAKDVCGVVGAIVPDRGRAGRSGRNGAHHRVGGVDLQLNRLGGVAGGMDAVGDDHRDDVAHETHRVAGQRRTRRHEDRCAVTALQRRDAGDDARQIADPVGVQVGRAEGAPHPRHGTGRREIQARDAPGGFRGCHEHGVKLTGQGDVVAEPPFAGQQPPVLDARRAGTDTEA